MPGLEFHYRTTRATMDDGCKWVDNVTTDMTVDTMDERVRQTDEGIIHGGGIIKVVPR